MLAGGKRHALGGQFYEPTVLSECTEDMVITREETFGPVAPLYRFADEAEVIRLANKTEYGLASYFFARDVGRVFRVAEALEAGIVSVNEGIFSTEVAPFGGFKHSGIGREGLEVRHRRVPRDQIRQPRWHRVASGVATLRPDFDRIMAGPLRPAIASLIS